MKGLKILPIAENNYFISTTILKNNNPVDFWLITADMGYGHQRVAYTLNNFTDNKIITINTHPATSKKERKIWKIFLSVYEFFSRSYSFPIIGKLIFSFLNFCLKIKPDEPYRNLSRPTFQNKNLDYFINKGLCEGILNQIKNNKVPLVTTFYAPAIAADSMDFPNIFCIICDSDINRIWVASDPAQSNVKYLAPCESVVNRLKMYGVKNENIFLTGPPLPHQLIGGAENSIVLTDFSKRLKKLTNNPILLDELLKHNIPIEINNSTETNNILTISYVVGGAGAFKETGKHIAYSLKNKLINNQVKLNLIAGTKVFVKEYFQKIKDDLATENINIIFSENLYDYFEAFNSAIRTTDILWTKPGELSFYCALGIPIIIAEPLGSQEEFNKKWILQMGAGIEQKNPKQTDQWLFEFLKNDALAKASINGFNNAPKNGLYNILSTIGGKDGHSNPNL